MTSLTMAKAHIEYNERCAHALNIFDALRTLESAKRDAAKADVYCNSNDYELAHHDAMTARISLRQALSNAGIDPDIVEGN